MNIEKIHNTTVNLPDREVKPGEVISNVQICPIGDFPNGDHQQHCTAEALQNVVKDWTERGSKEILVDFEHNSESHEPNSDTSAAAWVSNVRVDPERGLVGDFKLTDVGAEAISNRRLRFLSVSWFVNKETHEPIRITSIALTNKPNIPVAPILNKGPVPGVKTVEEKKGSKMDIKKITQALGLADDADEAIILAGIKEGQDAKAKVAELQANAEKQALEAEAEDFAEKNSKKCNKDVLKAQYLANKEVAKALVAGIPDGARDARRQQGRREEAHRRLVRAEPRRCRVRRADPQQVRVPLRQGEGRVPRAELRRHRSRPPRPRQQVSFVHPKERK